ncbi:MAG: Fe-S protein assembly co-chaperone HscB [Pseudomonadota bacterium]
MNSSFNAFQLFDLPILFNVDLNTLEDKYRRLRIELHPDRFTHQPVYEQRLAAQRYVLLHDAFSQLKDPLKRGIHLLQQYGITFDVETLRVSDISLLEQQLEWRESAEEAKNAEQLLLLKTEIENAYQETLLALENDFATWQQKNINVAHPEKSNVPKELINYLGHLASLENISESIRRRL